jgi:hypothetical protein
MRQPKKATHRFSVQCLLLDEPLADMYRPLGPTPCVRIDVARVFPNLGAREESVTWE